MFSAAGSAAADAPFSFATTPGRLPKSVVPLEYHVTIVPRPASMTLDGSERVLLDVRERTAQLVFNALNIRFRSARVDGQPAVAIDANDRTQRTTLRLARTLSRGRHVLDLAYAGRLETTGQGMFLQQYQIAPGRVGTLISTQFESTDARRMFPCWDEPAFRATYALSVVVPAAWQAVSNMPVIARTTRGRVATISFERTPSMASYLLEVTAGDLAHLRAIDARGTAHEVWTVSGQASTGAYALANSQRILTDYDRYFDYRFPLPRLASIAVPGGFDGAMENWGAITYKDTILLLGPTGTVDQRQDIYSTQAHEMAHQWFGDLVSPAWWDDLWLNESFASWMAAKQTDRAHPDWHWWQNQDADKESAMNADARITTHPIQQPVADDTDAEAAFDSEITYAKGQAFLRMLEAYVGPDAFRAGIRTYMRKRAFSNATGADLWDALGGQTGKAIGTLAHNWIFSAGFPIVTVSATCAADGRRTIALHQDRFLLDGSDASYPRWTIPVGIAAGSDPPHYTLLTARDQTGIAAGRCDEPLRANAGNVGFYRVAYDDATFALDRAALARFPADDAIALLDDEWARVSAGAAPLAQYLSLIPALGPSRNARAWEQITGALETIDRAERGTAAETAFEAFGRRMLAGPARAVSFDAHHDDTPTSIALRRTLVRALGSWDDPQVLAWAQLQFARIQARRDSVPPSDEATALVIVGEHADAATFAALTDLARSARNETEFHWFAAAVGAVRDPHLAEQALRFALSSAVPAQAQDERIALIYAIANDHPALSYRFLQANATRLFQANSVEDSVFIAQEIPETYWDAAPIDEIVRWVKAHTPPEATPELARGAERARFERARRDRLAAQANAIERTGSPATAGGR